MRPQAPQLAQKVVEFTRRVNGGDPSDQFNAAITYAIGVREDCRLFLELWNEGDWESIVAEFPDFEPPALENEIVSALELEAMYAGAPHEAYPKEDWQLMAAGGHTILGYWDWVREQLVAESGLGDRGDDSLADLLQVSLDNILAQIIVEAKALRHGRQAMEAIRAMDTGEWDNPALVRVGRLERGQHARFAQILEHYREADQALFPSFKGPAP